MPAPGASVAAKVGVFGASGVVAHALANAPAAAIETIQDVLMKFTPLVGPPADGSGDDRWGNVYTVVFARTILRSPETFTSWLTLGSHRSFPAIMAIRP